MFMIAYYRLENCREQVLADVKKLLAEITDCSAIDKQIAVREEELEEINTLVRVEIQNNASQANMQEAFDARFERLRERYDAAEAAIAELRKQKFDRKNRERLIGLFLDEFSRTDPIEMWDDRLWVMLLDSATVYRDSSMEFKFYGGQSIHVEPDAN